MICDMFVQIECDVVWVVDEEVDEVIFDDFGE